MTARALSSAAQASSNVVDLASRRRKPTGGRPEAPRSRKTRERRTAPSIVVVDDSADLRIIFSETLRHAGWDVRAFADATEALAAIEARRPDVVMTDINLGTLSGRGLARALRADPSTEDLVIVAASGSVAPTPALVRTFDAFLAKPVDVTTLDDTLRDLLP